MSLPDFPDHLEQDNVTSDLIRAVAGSFNATYSALKELIADVRRLKKHVAALKAQPPVLAVAIHSRPVPGRKRGRPEGRAQSEQACLRQRPRHALMPRKKTGRRRGRPRLRFAKHRQTTRRGRRGEFDQGAPLLRQRKLRLTGRADLELSPAAVLFARGQLDAQQYDILGQVTMWLRRLAGSLGPHGFTIGALWASIAGALVGVAGITVPIAVGDGADRARHVLGHMLRRLDGSRDLVVAIAEGRIPEVVVHVIEGRITRADVIELEGLRHGLDAIAGRRAGT